MIRKSVSSVLSFGGKIQSEFVVTVSSNMEINRISREEEEVLRKPSEGVMGPFYLHEGPCGMGT